MKEAGSTPPVSASSILAAGAASSPGRTLALSSPQPEPTSPCPQSPQTPPLDPRGDVNGYALGVIGLELAIRFACEYEPARGRQGTADHWLRRLHAPFDLAGV